MASKSKTPATGTGAVTAQVIQTSAGQANPTSELSSSQFTSLLSAIQQSETRLEQKFADFKSDIKEAQEEAATKAANRVRRDKPYGYKKKGHEEQAAFNDGVQDIMKEADDALEAATDAPAIQRAKAALQKGTALLADRQKLIKIADRSANGWGVVAEYTADELADDSDDEKRLERAEKAADRKAGLKKRKRLPSSAKASAPSYVRRYVTAPPASYGNLAVPYSATHSQPSGGPSGRRSGSVAGPSLQRAVGPCFACGEMGHLRMYCPRTQSQEKRWYPFHGCASVCECVLSCCDFSVVGGGGDCVMDSRSGDDHVVGSNPVLNAVGVNDLDSATVQWELESSVGDAVPDRVPVVVKGRLKSCISFWKEEVKASDFILGIIDHGYVLPLKSEPTAYTRGNHQSAAENSSFVQDSVLELLATGCVVESPDSPHICSPLSVVESSSGKKRLVVNLRHLNRFLWKQKFKYEDLRVAMLLLEKNDFLFSFDLKSGYHHVDIAREHWKYLGFLWQGRYYVFTVLPFGLSSACYIFTKLVRPLVGYWRAKGLRIVVYLDDGLCAVQGESRARAASALVKDTLDHSGFVVNVKKSIWAPTQRLQWLGFVIDLSKGHIEAPIERLTAIQSKLELFCKLKKLGARQLASVVGSIISMSLAIGPVSRFMTRSMYWLLETRLSWWDMLEITPDARQELEFWKACLADYNCQPIWHSPSAVRVVFSDASDTGYGGYVVEHGSSVAYGQWTKHEAQQSSTWRELAAVLQVLKSVAAKLANFRVRWFTDNQNVARILSVGSKKPLLHALATKVFTLSVQHNIRLEPEWIPRDLNERADALSRIVDYDDWMLNPVVFADIEKLWGPHSVDRFASCHNRQVPRFNSRCWNPGAEAVDAFTVNWEGENNWWCPPIGLIPRVLRHAQVCRASGSIVVPLWLSAPFWPLLYPYGTGYFASFVRDARQLPLVNTLFIPGLSGASLFNGETPNTKVLVLRCDFSCGEPPCVCLGESCRL